VIPLEGTDFVVAVTLLGLSAFFSGSESALFALPRHYIRRLGETPHHPISRLISDQRRLLSVLLVGNMFVNLLYSAFALLVALRFLGYGLYAFGVVEIVALAALVAFGEMLPKSLALLSPVLVSRMVATPLLTMSVILSPPARLLDAVSQRFTSRLLSNVRRPEDGHLSATIQSAVDEGVVDSYEAQLLQQILRLRNVWVEKIMTPRVRIVACDIGISREELLRRLKETGHRKLPVYDGEIENIVGVLHTKDLYLYPEKSVRELMREPLFVPEKQPLDIFLHTLISRSATFAVVVDEFGGIAGLATLEDAVEEIVGEIEDEHDRSQKRIRLLGKGRFLIRGDCEMKEWMQAARIQTKTDANTVAGYLEERLEKIPEKGETFEEDGFVYTVLRAKPEGVTLLLAERTE